ncbi:hypothetical protein AN958_05694 [Leucoagaricus sp. SymC.cos]|nr:hypothetical protein AN958_05694 [Leucoagaricus sp. SymC.cos]
MLSSLGVVDPFDSNHRLVSSPLYTTPTLSFQRLMLVIYGCASLVTSLVFESVVLRQGNIWFSFFTHLTFIGLIAYLVVSTYHGFKYKPSPSSSYTYPLQQWPQSLQVLHVLLLSTVTTLPFLVTICYWVLLLSPTTFSTPYRTWSSISFHMFNSVVALLEIITTNIPPLPWMTLPACLLVLLAYLGMAYITHASQGVYPYAFLDPHIQHSKLAAYICGIALAEVIIFILVRYAIILRDKISKFGLCHEGDTQPSKEGLDEWEEVHWNDVEHPRKSAGNTAGGTDSERSETDENCIGVAV